MSLHIKLRNAFAALSAIAAIVTTAAAQEIATLHDALPEHVRESGVIKVGAPQVVPPQVFRRDDQLTGLAVDLATAMEPILGVKFEWLDMQWPGIIPGLQSGAIDVSMGMVSYNKERTDLLNMIPTVEDAVGVIAQPGTGITQEASNLCGKAVGTVQGAFWIPLIEAENVRCSGSGSAPIDLKIYQSNPTAAAAFQARNIDGWIVSYLVAAENVKANTDGRSAYAILGWRAPPITIATAKSEFGLAEALAGALQELDRQGTYKSILAKYGITTGAIKASQLTVNPDW